MSKLETAIQDLMSEVRNNREKLAEAVSDEVVLEPSPTGKMLSKLASAVREVSVEPTYEDLDAFLRGLK